MGARFIAGLPCLLHADDRVVATRRSRAQRRRPNTGRTGSQGPDPAEDLLEQVPPPRRRQRCCFGVASSSALRLWASAPRRAAGITARTEQSRPEGAGTSAARPRRARRPRRHASVVPGIADVLPAGRPVEPGAGGTGRALHAFGAAAPRRARLGSLNIVGSCLAPEPAPPLPLDCRARSPRRRASGEDELTGALSRARRRDGSLAAG